jgi:hypothetical protein
MCATFVQIRVLYQLWWVLGTLGYYLKIPSGGGNLISKIPSLDGILAKIKKNHCISNSYIR